MGHWVILPSHARSPSYWLFTQTQTYREHWSNQLILQHKGPVFAVFLTDINRTARERARMGQIQGCETRLDVMWQGRLEDTAGPSVTSLRLQTNLNLVMPEGQVLERRLTLFFMSYLPKQTIFNREFVKKNYEYKMLYYKNKLSIILIIIILVSQTSYLFKNVYIILYISSYSKTISQLIIICFSNYFFSNSYSIKWYCINCILKTMSQK